MRNREHVAFRLTGWNCADDLPCFRVDDRDRLIQFGGHVEQAVLWPEYRAMRPHSVTEFDVGRDLVRGKIDDVDVLAVCARTAYAGVSVNGHNREPAIGRSGNFVPGHAVFVYRCQYLSGDRVDDAKAVVAFLSD